MTDVCGSPSTAVPLDPFPVLLQEPARSSETCWRRRKEGGRGAEGQQSKVNRTSTFGGVWAVVEVQNSEGATFSGFPNVIHESGAI